jgi:hypothetical protein
MNMESKTFREIYEGYAKRPPLPTPRKEFVRRMADVTKKSEATVKMWVIGRQVPDALTQEVLAKELNVPAEVLFPKEL